MVDRLILKTSGNEHAHTGFGEQRYMNRATCSRVTSLSAAKILAASRHRPSSATAGAGQQFGACWLVMQEPYHVSINIET